MAFLDIFSKKKEKEQERIKVEVDHREKNSLVSSYLIEKGFQVEFKQLAVADYIVKETAIERKTISDFKSSIINKRIMSQLLELKQYDKCILILEGINTEMYEGIIHENAFRGFLLSVALDYKVPIIFTEDEKDTAKYISVLAKKEKKDISFRASKILMSDKEQLQFILEGFPNIGPKKAKLLLEKFKNIRGIINSDEEQLRPILGKRSDEFIKLVKHTY